MGGALEVDSSKDTITCPYCRATYSVSELLDISDEVKIEQIKAETIKEVEKEKLKHEVEKENR